MFVEPDKQDESDGEETQTVVKPKSGGGGKGLLASTIILAILVAGAGGGAGYLFTQWNKTKESLARTQSSLRGEQEKSATLEQEKTSLTEQKARTEEELNNTKTALQAADQQRQQELASKEEALAKLAAKEAEEKALKKDLDDLQAMLQKAKKSIGDLEGQVAGQPKDPQAESGNMIAQLTESLKEAKVQADRAVRLQSELDKMLGKLEAGSLVKGSVASVNALEKIVVIDTGTQSVAKDKQFVISNAQHEWVATVAVQEVQGSLSIARILRPMGEVTVAVGDMAIEVPDKVLARDMAGPDKGQADPKK